MGDGESGGSGSVLGRLIRSWACATYICQLPKLGLCDFVTLRKLFQRNPASYEAMHWMRGGTPINGYVHMGVPYISYSYIGVLLYRDTHIGV